MIELDRGLVTETAHRFVKSGHNEEWGLVRLRPDIRHSRSILLAALFALVMAIAGLVPAYAVDPTFPELSGRIVDQANLLDAGQEAALTISLAALEEKSTDQLVIVTVPSLQGYPIEDFSNRLLRHWQIGQKGKNNGILLVVAPNERKVRIEVGYGLEPIMTDALSSAIIQNRILPVFRRGDFAGGILVGAKDIQDSLLGDAEEVKKRAAGARRDPNGQGSWSDWLPLLFWCAVVAFVLWSNYRSMKQGLSTPASRRRGGVVIIPGGWGGSSTWGGGSSGGGGWSGGGGFGGGGGSGGGGGASGGW